MYTFSMPFQSFWCSKGLVTLTTLLRGRTVEFNMSSEWIFASVDGAIISTELTHTHYESLEEGNLVNYLNDHSMTNIEKIQNKTNQMKSHVWSIMTPNIAKFPPIHPMILFLRKSELTHFDNFGLLYGGVCIFYSKYFFFLERYFLEIVKS